VSLEPRKNDDGDDHYLTVIDLDQSPQGLKIGMTVRVAFVE
jgi:hypothetical protein